MKLTIATALIVLTAGTTVAGDGIPLRSGTVRGDRPTVAAPDSSLRLVKLQEPPTAARLAALEAAVERVYTYLPHHAFLVRTGGEGDHLAAAGVAWSSALVPGDKISPELAATPVDDPTRRPVMIHVLPDADLDATVLAVEALLGHPVEGAARHRRFARIRVLADGAEIAALRTSLPNRAEVVWLEREARKALLNDSTSWVGQSGTDGAGATPVYDQGLYGEGQIVGVLDTGLDADMCYFDDPAQAIATNPCDGGTAVNPDHRKVQAVDFLWTTECDGGISSTEWDTHGHGTHVAGTVAGDKLTWGTHDGRDGMAPAARLVIQDCGIQFNDCADCPGIGCPVIDLVPVFEQAYLQGARIHTNSWGDEENDPAFGEYTSASEDADTVMWNHPDYLLVFAAGNNGGSFNTVDSPSTAKSALSVGATSHGTSAESVASYSSRGPTDDGRIKPSVMMVGSSVYSAANDYSVNTDNCGDTSSSGTSMAAPGVAGFAALVRQYFTDGYFPTGSAVPAYGFVPSGALLRAALVNSGEQMTFAGTIPNDDQGWGRVQLDTLLHFPDDPHTLWVEDDATGFAGGAVGASRTFSLEVTSSAEPLEVTLAWTDYPAPTLAAETIVNDLDLEVSGPNGTFLGNVFSGGVSVTGGSADRINTLENVLVAAPTPGIWTVTVTAHTVPQGPQPFALVATGALPIEAVFADDFETGTIAAWSSEGP